MSTGKSDKVVWHHTRVDRKQRMEVFDQQGATVWLTGLSGAGKSTLAFLLEQILIARHFKAYVLDGDNIRHGLNNNLGFSPGDREENIRRVGEVARLFADAGMLVFASFISPYRNDRELVRKMHQAEDLPFIEIFVDTPLEICEQRDPKKMYAKARRGEIKGFTGIDSPYERPQNPELVVTTHTTPQECAAVVIAYLTERGVIHK